VPSFTTRCAAAADVDAVLAFWRAYAEDTNRTNGREGVQAPIARELGGLILAVDTRQIVGSLIVGWDRWRSHLHPLALRPDRSRQRMATALLHGAWPAGLVTVRDERQPEWSRRVKFLLKAPLEPGPVRRVGR
jgi:hypothetical protein